MHQCRVYAEVTTEELANIADDGPRSERDMTETDMSMSE